MRKITVLLIGIALSGCSGFGEYISDTFWPMEDQHAPAGEGDMMRRVRGGSPAGLPLVAQTGDIWPGQPDPVPTIQDVSNPDSRFNHNFQNSLGDLNNDPVGQAQLHDAETLAIGEEVNTKNGVTRRSQAVFAPGNVPGALPESVPDNAKKYLEGPNSDSVIIPNGDGTTTVVAPDGSVKILRGDAASVLSSRRAAGGTSGKKTGTISQGTEKPAVQKEAYPGKTADNTEMMAIPVVEEPVRETPLTTKEAAAGQTVRQDVAKRHLGRVSRKKHISHISRSTVRKKRTRLSVHRHKAKVRMTEQGGKRVVHNRAVHKRIWPRHRKSLWHFHSRKSSGTLTNRHIRRVHHKRRRHHHKPPSQAVIPNRQRLDNEE